MRRVPRAPSPLDRAARRFRSARRGVAVRSVVVRTGVDRRGAGRGVDARSRETVSERVRSVGRPAGSRLRPRRARRDRDGATRRGHRLPAGGRCRRGRDASARARAWHHRAPRHLPLWRRCFDGIGGSRPHVAALWGPPGSGKRVGGARSGANRAHARVRADRVASRRVAACGVVARPQPVRDRRRRRRQSMARVSRRGTGQCAAACPVDGRE